MTHQALSYTTLPPPTDFHVLSCKQMPLSSTLGRSLHFAKREQETMGKQKRISSLALLKRWLNFNVLEISMNGLSPIQCKSGAGQQTGKNHIGRRIIAYPTLPTAALTF